MKILVADDDPVSQSRSSARWSTGGTQVEVVERRPRGLPPADGAGAPTLAILDWSMPGLEGPEVCRRVRAAALRVQPYLVMLTTRQRPRISSMALEAGADDFLSKPFNRVELLARLHAGMRILNLHRALTDRIQELEESRRASTTSARSCRSARTARRSAATGTTGSRSIATSPSTATGSRTRSVPTAWNRWSDNSIAAR